MSDYEVLPPNFRPKVLSVEETARRQAARAAAKGQDPSTPTLDATVLQTGPIQNITPVEQNFAEVTMPTPPPATPVQPTIGNTPQTPLSEVVDVVKTGAEIVGAAITTDVTPGPEIIQEGADIFNNLIGGN